MYVGMLCLLCFSGQVSQLAVDVDLNCPEFPDPCHRRGLAKELIRP